MFRFVLSLVSFCVGELHYHNTQGNKAQIPNETRFSKIFSSATHISFMIDKQQEFIRMMTAFPAPDTHRLFIPTKLKNLTSKNTSSNAYLGRVRQAKMLPLGYEPRDRDVLCGRM